MNTVQILLLVQLGLTLAVLAVLLAQRRRRNYGWRELYKEQQTKAKAGDDEGVSFIDLAEFDELDPEIKELWGEFMTNGFMPIFIEDLNESWKKNSESQKRQVKQELKAILEKARLDIKKGVKKATKPGSKKGKKAATPAQ